MLKFASPIYLHERKSFINVTNPIFSECLIEGNVKSINWLLKMEFKVFKRNYKHSTNNNNNKSDDDVNVSSNPVNPITPKVPA